MERMKRNTHALKSCAVLAFAALVALVAPLGASAKESEARFSKDSYAASVAAAIGHELSAAERGVANATWDFYDVKWKKEWTEERYAFAVERGAKNCGSKAMTGSAKAGKKGKQGLGSLVESTEAGAEKVSDWIKKHTDSSAKEKAESGN
jgi:hypothetical protein